MYCFAQHVRRVIEKFRATGSVLKRKSLRCLSTQTNLSLRTCRKASEKILHLHAYKITVTPELLAPDLP